MGASPHVGACDEPHTARTLCLTSWPPHSIPPSGPSPFVGCLGSCGHLQISMASSSLISGSGCRASLLHIRYRMDISGENRHESRCRHSTHHKELLAVKISPTSSYSSILTGPCFNMGFHYHLLEASPSPIWLHDRQPQRWKHRKAMALARHQHVFATQRQHTEESDLVSSIQSCSDQLRQLCGDSTDDEEADDGDEDAHSAVDIASECMLLLENIHFTDSEQVESAKSDELGGWKADPPEQTQLMKEINALGDELQSLMQFLCDVEGNGALAKTTTRASIVPIPASEICTSPKMKELTTRLTNRPAPYLMARHTARNRHSFSTQLKQLSDTLKTKAQLQSPTRKLFSDAAFWRQHQSKSFRQHIARQSQARKQEEAEQKKLAKAVEYRYRRVSKPCYPLAQKPTALQVASPTTSIKLPGVDASNRKTRHSYAARLGMTGKLPNPEADEDRGLLCGVYMYGKRRKGMLYLTCSSIELLKTRAKQRFQLPEGVTLLNLYREEVSKGGRKYLHRISSFEELRNGDLLCATTDSYQDMAILCAWMKQRQRKTRTPSAPSTTTEKAAPKQDNKLAPVHKGAAVPEAMSDKPTDSLAFQPPLPPVIKLWDQHGRLMNISHRLPF